MLRRLFDPCCPEDAHEALDGEGVVVGNDLTPRRPRQMPLLAWYGVVVGVLLSVFALVLWSGVAL